MAQEFFHLFVYGTLKKGERNHDKYCTGVGRIVEARIRGRLYAKPSGTPILDIPAVDELAEGCADRIGDIVLQPEMNRRLAEREFSWEYDPADGEWDEITGELMEIPAREESLYGLDWLEDFLPPDNIVYRRVMARVFPVDSSGKPVAAWVYVQKPWHEVRRIGNRWYMGV